MKKIISSLLTICIILSFIAVVQVYAANDMYPYTVNCSNSNPAIGNEITIKIALTDYKNIEKKIRGLQIDITNIDKSIFEVVEHHTLIDETGVASNMTSYSEANNRVRLVYANINGTLGDSVTDVMELKLKINHGLTEEGSISLPITLKIQTTDVGAPGRITQKTSLDINYKIKSEIISANVEWGNMEFTYSDGQWNPATHQYEDGGWKCESGSNKITVNNNSDIDIVSSAQYVPSEGYSEISGKITDENGNEVTENTIGSGNTASTFLVLSGKPNQEFEEQNIGSVKVTIFKGE